MIAGISKILRSPLKSNPHLPLFIFFMKNISPRLNNTYRLNRLTRCRAHSFHRARAARHEPTRGVRDDYELGRDQICVQDGGRAPPVQAQETGPRLRLLPRVPCQEGIPLNKKKGGGRRK